MAKRYCVRIKSPSGMTVQEQVVLSNAPKSAIEQFCEQNSRKALQVVKYSSLHEMMNAYFQQGGSCLPCEVFQVSGDRKNFYLTYTG